MRSAAETRINPWHLPPRIEAYFQQSWTGPKPPEEITSWKGTPPTLVLMGRNGNGKTRLAAAIFRRAVKAGGFHYRTRPHPLWWSAGDLVQAMKAEFDEPVKTVRRHAEETTLLGLDDLGGERSNWTDYYVEEISGLLSHRWDNGRATVITCNWLEQDWHQFSPRLASRFLGREGLHFIMKSRDRRQD